MWNGTAAVVIDAASPAKEQKTILLVLGLCPAYSDLEIAVMQSLQYGGNDFTSSILNLSSVQWAGNACYTCRVSSIKQATVQVRIRACPAWSGTAVVVIDAASPV